MRTLTQIDPLIDAELDHIRDFLASCKGGRAMNAEQLDGFFAALIARSETVMREPRNCDRVRSSGAQGAYQYFRAQRETYAGTTTLTHSDSLNGCGLRLVELRSSGKL
jgi:hypothetical protein